jgi:hypothetical protein
MNANEEPKVWKEASQVSRSFLIWWALFAGFCLAKIVFEAAAPKVPGGATNPLAVYAIGALGAFSVFGLQRLVRWLSSWRNLRRTLVGLAIFATCIATLYTVENWRGQRAWEECKRELEAKGAVLDWNAYIPAPVPDEQNIFKVPKMQEWFVGKRDANHPGPGVIDWQQNANASPVIVAEISVVPADRDPNRAGADAALRFDDPGARTLARKLINGAVGPAACGYQNSIFVARPWSQIKPARILLLTDNAITTNDVSALFPADTISLAAPWNYYPNRHPLTVESVGSNTFHVSLNRSEFCVAAEYLAWSDRFETDFDLIREALKRPYARMDGDYTSPLTQPIPNFVYIRSLAQTLAQRAQCQLLLGQPEKALHDISLLHDIRALLEAKPTGKPITLVAAMINVAITGIYVNTLADGFRLMAWREPQLMAIQQQLKQINLMPLVAEGFRGEQVFACRTLENTSRTGLKKLFNFSGPPKLLVLSFAPQGWLYQNMVTHARLIQRCFDGFDPVQEIVWPHRQNAIPNVMESSFAHFSPYTFIAASTTPNFYYATQTSAYHQNRANEALVTCALERYRIERGRCPESLDALVPRYVEKLPHDIIGGQPLKYRRTDDGQFILYSVGWNETDDGGKGTPAYPNSTGVALDQGDWVWRAPQK